MREAYGNEDPEAQTRAKQKYLVDNEKINDTLYLEYGYRQEQIEKAIVKY